MIPTDIALKGGGYGLPTGGTIAGIAGFLPILFMFGAIVLILRLIDRH